MKDGACSTVSPLKLSHIGSIRHVDLATCHEKFRFCSVDAETKGRGNRAECFKALLSTRAVFSEQDRVICILDVVDDCGSRLTSGLREKVAIDAKLDGDARWMVAVLHHLCPPLKHNTEVQIKKYWGHHTALAEAIVDRKRLGSAGTDAHSCLHALVERLD